MEKLKVAQIGMGKWGKKLSLVAAKYSELIIADRESFDSYLADKEIQAVIIATPIDTHFEIAMRALEANKHVFLEKPGTDSSQKIAELAVEAEKRELVLQIGYEFAYAREIGEMQALLQSGKVKKISFVWKKWGTFELHPVINLLVHELSIIKACGIQNIEITKYEETKGEHNPDSIHIEAKSGNLEIIFDIDRASEIKEKTVTLEGDMDKFEWKDGGTNLVDLEMEAFISSIQNKSAPLTDGKFGKEILQIIEKLPYRAS